MKKKTFRDNLKTPAFRELLIIGLINVILISFVLSTQLTETIVNFFYKHQSTRLDDMLVSFSAIGFFLTIYTFRRYNEKIELIRSKERTEANLYKTHEQLELLVHSSSAILYRAKIDADFTLIDTTENVKQVLGYSKDEMFEERFWANHVHPDDAPEVFRELPVLFETGFFGIEFRFEHKDGSWRWMRAEMKCLYDKNKKPYEMVGNWWDITNQKQVQEEINASKNRLEVLMQSTSAIVFNVKATGGFYPIYYSENITAILGYTQEEVLQKHFWSSNIHPGDLPGVLAEVPVLYKTGAFSFQYRFKHKNGTWRWMQSDMKCLFNADGTPDEFVGTWWDISEQKQIGEDIKAANERFELSFEATRNVMYDWNLITNTLWLSDEIYRSYGYDKKTVNPHIHWWEQKIHHDDRGAIISSAMDALANKDDSWSGEYRFQVADGTYADIYCRAHISYSDEGQPLRWIGSMNDITILKNTEAELKKALLKSEESARAKSEFLANMSHEIRTPLNGIVGMADLALDTELNAQQRRYLESVRLSCDSLMTLINDILDLSKIEAGKLDLSPVEFSLNDEVPVLLSPLALRASNKKLELIFSIENDVPNGLFADIHRLQQIITNLVGNAIKFTERGEVVLKAALQSATEDEAMLLFSVADTGIGIPEHKLDAVFEDFSQADGSTTRKYGGTGLGLSITKRLVELMGGRIWVESVENKGSTFYFTIKVKLQTPQKKQRFLPLPILDDTPVLVVEDNDFSRECLIRILENFRMKPTGIASGEKAIDEVKKAAYSGNPYPLVLTDIFLSGEMDGFDLAESIKEDKDLADTHIIVISMSQQAADRDRFALAGVDQFFSKPFSQSDLLDGIQNTLSAGNKITFQAIQNNAPEAIPVILNTADRLKILLAEDNLVNQEVAAGMLKKKGHTVIIANNGAEASALYHHEAFDLVLMDVQMPLLNGYEATARIRDIENVTGKYTPIIGLTANAMKGDREKCLEAGMDDYVSKPVRIKDLMSAIDRIKQKKPMLENQKATIEQEPEVNLGSLLENLDGDNEMLESILGKFDGTVLAQMNAIEMNVKKGKASEINTSAHTLKGQCMLVEMGKVVKLAQQMETLASENALSELSQLIPALKSELQKGLKALKKARIELSEGKAA